jgi:chromosome segregation ATPase
MSRMYNSLKEALQETLHRGNTDPTRIDSVEGNHTAGLTDEIDELESIVVDRIGRLKTAAKEGEAVVAGQTAHAKQVIANLNASIASLETRLNETEGIIQGNQSDHQKMEESLTGEIQDLHNEVKKKEEALAGRDEEINDLKSKTDVTVKQVSQLEAEVAEAVNRARIAEEATESSKAKIVALETQLSETEEIVRTKDASNKGLVENLHVKIQELEIQVRDSEELLADRETQAKDLKFQLRTLKNWIKEMSPIFRQAEEALAVIDLRETGTGLPGEHLTKGEEQPTSFDPNGWEATSKPMDTAQETVSPKFFDRMTAALTHVLGPGASIVVRGHVAALGESMERFPQVRVTELVEIVSQEIADKNLKIGFREVLDESQ